jgi:phosphoribosyl 1,2-cyclic phosphodiesterase
MTFESYYSSSTSNLYIVTAPSGRRLLIEAGTTWARLEKKIGYELKSIAACLVSHEHADHSKAVPDVMKAGIDVYGSAGTFEAIGVNGQRRARTIEDKTLVRLDEFEFLAFRTNHDAAEPLGFVIRDRVANEYLLFATDTSHIRQRFNLKFSIIALECSYDKDILQERVDTNDINETVAQRLLSSHQEKSVAIRYIAAFCDTSRCREIHLLHTSRDNLNLKRTKKHFQARFPFIDIKIGRKR